ncbi:MAG: hydroxymethylpyrimidine/phosphomethylpyrimidine kinase [Betaproteobacteria bacterium RIFCSPLOWO2_12_FULL_66_14]|nr:MAG: hydroxymethylpyrimidine/phosphomethylpyrimidine kinase [Betaproteobacteria bacterium RIFCSPLOWO2_12_FULL_66_14]
MAYTALPPIVLSFAATDPTGGAGIQADLLTLASLGCHPLTVVTALTVQDTSGVEAIHAVDPECVTEQARRVLADMPVQAFKIGFVGSAGNVAAIASLVAAHPRLPVVLDPVIASGRGDRMASEEAMAKLRELLLPRATLLTPNSDEARMLAGPAGAAPGAELSECARRLIGLGCEYVLVTGTHENTPKVINTLYDARGEVRADAWERLPGSYHGSGCTLASACAAFLARGKNMTDAVREAQSYTWAALAAAYRPGKGQHLPNHLLAARSIHSAAEHG